MKIEKIRSKILVIELDGATWDVINPLVNAGKLPNIASLINKGVSGNLISDPPLISPRLWVSIFSGKKSNDHGVEFFGSSSAMVKSKRLWDICSDKGLKVGVFGSFVTWPPYPVNGFMVPSIFSLGPETYPEQYKFLQELTLGERKKNLPKSGGKGSKFSRIFQSIEYAYKLKRHGVHIATYLDGIFFYLNNIIKNPHQDERYWKKGILHLRICTDFFSYLYKKYKPDFSTIHIHLCDALSHRYWKYYEPGKFNYVANNDINKYGGVIPDSYIEADRTIGCFVKMLDNNTNILILSDHGSAAMETLRESFKLKSDILLKLLGIGKNVIPANVGFLTFLYFFDKGLMARISKSLDEMRFSDNGQKVFDIIFEESLFGIRLTEKLWGTKIDPDRMIDAGSYGKITFSTIFSPHKMEVSGDHKLEGVFILSGPGIKKGFRMQDASIYDITPTILTIMGLPAASDMHGRILKDIFDSEVKCSYIGSYDSIDTGRIEENQVDIDKVKERLKVLGYL